MELDSKGMPALRSHPHRRLWAALSLLLHLSVVGLLPLADAYLDSGAHPEPHVHAQNGPDPFCRPVHDHLDCALCRVLDARGAASAGPSASGLAATLLPGASRPDRLPVLGNAPVSSLRSRAPPPA